jgi:hypothetical protein
MSPILAQILLPSNSVLYVALFVPKKTPCQRRRVISPIYGRTTKLLSPVDCVSNVSSISLLRKSAEDARKDPRLWASRSEDDEMVDADFPLDEGDYGEEPATAAEHHRTYRLCSGFYKMPYAAPKAPTRRETRRFYGA